MRRPAADIVGVSHLLVYPARTDLLAARPDGDAHESQPGKIAMHQPNMVTDAVVAECEVAYRVDAELVALANTAGTTIVTLLATDAWEKAKYAIGALWRGELPDRTEAVEAELADARSKLVAARTARDEAREHVLVGELAAEWQGRLRRLLTARPEVAAQLRRLLDEELTPALPPAGQMSTGNVEMRAKASGHGRVYQVGQGSQHITER